MIALTSFETALHQKAKGIARQFLRSELDLILVLQEVSKNRFYKKLDCKDLYTYAVRELSLSEHVAYPFIRVSLKALEIPQLLQALREQSLTVSKATRIVSALTKTGALHLIEYAKTHTNDQINHEVARLDPKAKCRDSVKPLSEEDYLLKAAISKKVYEKLKRVECLQAQKNEGTAINDILEASFDEYLKHHDPVVKAERAMKRREKQTVKSVSDTKVCVKDQNTSENSGKVGRKGRAPLTAKQIHSVNFRDRGQCTFKQPDGSRCQNKRWVEKHHITPVGEGGSNEPENLTTLCSHHHDLVHQLSLPLDEQVTWLRSRTTSYGVRKRVITPASHLA